jgi:AcrR family transcriptional regulator
MATSNTVNSPAERLLAAAAKLFVRHGIRAVGIERLIAEAGVARASLYQSFGSKDELIAAYLDRQDALDRAAWQRAAADAGSDPVDRALLLFDLAEASARKRRYRGCLYLNAATEFPDPHHPATAAIARHREWVTDLLSELLVEAGVHDVAETAAAVQLLYDGALAGSKLSKSTAPIMRGRKMARRTIADALAGKRDDRP